MKERYIKERREGKGKKMMLTEGTKRERKGREGEGRKGRDG